MVSTVDLPQPEWPMTLITSPCLIVEVEAVDDA